MLPDTVTCYVDSTVFLPLLTAYALATRPARAPRRLMDRLPALMQGLHAEYQSKRREKETGEDVAPARG
jgi:deoxyhypusine synthase